MVNRTCLVACQTTEDTIRFGENSLSDIGGGNIDWKFTTLEEFDNNTKYDTFDFVIFYAPEYTYESDYF